MPLKRLSEYKRDDYTYESPDGDQLDITIIQTADRKYVEIKRGGSEETEVTWDAEMLLDIADAVRQAIQKPTVSGKSHALKKPRVVDRRDDATPSETIQASVEESMEQIEKTDDFVPVESFSPDHLKTDIEERLQRPSVIDPEQRVRRTKDFV
ncbi:MAG: hypothetical protein ACXAC5_00450 [Promethearchaeota archaeon]|jgi:hypothetical protein